jgi:peptide/nickel transport system substrate-binding protein
MNRYRPGLVLLVAVALLTLGVGDALANPAAPSGQAVMAWHVTLAPSWFDPSTAPP